MSLNPSCVSKVNVICERITESICTGTELNQPNNLSWPCVICNKNVTSSMKAMQCDACNKWCHIKCDCMSAEE